MAKIYRLAACFAFISIFLSSCSKEELQAEIPVYLSIQKIAVETDYVDEGTSHSKITTIWLYANGEHIGTFELPCTVPVLLDEGVNDVRVYPGIHINGISASRAIYEGFRRMDFQVNYQPSGSENADTIAVEQEKLTTSYTSNIRINIFETFDEAGLELAATQRSDTGIYKTDKPGEVFINPQDSSEENEQAGVMYTTAKNDLVEVATVNAYDLPQTGANVYLEVTYKSNIPFDVGVISQGFTGSRQLSTLRVNPQEDWNKIYVNLVSEIGALGGASAYKIFFRASHEDGTDTGKVFLDNLKLVY